VLADAGYGCSGPFRHGLSARGLVWSVGVPRTQKVYTTGARPIWPSAGRGRPRKQPVPSELAKDAASALAGCRWRRIAWRLGAKGALAPSVGFPPASRAQAAADGDRPEGRRRGDGDSGDAAR
jgi:SRSO17 transposase